MIYLRPPHGLSLLNTSEETDKGKAVIPKILDAIKDDRPCVFIGFNGKEPVFEQIKNISLPDNRLFWVTDYDNNPGIDVRRFLSAPNTKGYIIKVGNYDSFLKELTGELRVGKPRITDKPFATADEILTNSF